MWGAWGCYALHCQCLVTIEATTGDMYSSNTSVKRFLKHESVRKQKQGKFNVQVYICQGQGHNFFPYDSSVTV